MDVLGGRKAAWRDEEVDPQQLAARVPRHLSPDEPLSRHRVLEHVASPSHQLLG